MAKIKARQIDTGTGPDQIVQTDGSGDVDADTLGGQPVGTGPNDIVALNGSSQLPAVDGSLLTNLPSPARDSWSARVSSSVTVNNSVSNVPVTGLSIPLTIVSGQNYSVIVHVSGTQALAAAGIRFFLNWPYTSFSSCDWEVAYYDPSDSSNVYSHAYNTQFNLTSGSALLKTDTTNGGYFKAVGHANFKTNFAATANLQLNFAQRVASAGNTTILRGGMIVVKD